MYLMSIANQIYLKLHSLCGHYPLDNLLGENQKFQMIMKRPDEFNVCYLILNLDGQ